MMLKPLVAFFIWIFLILTGFSAIAQTGPQLNYHGRIVDGITNLGVSGLRNFRIQVRTPAGLADNCLMYEETQSKNLVNGVFVINLNNGSGVRADATAPVYTVQQIFSNKNSFGSFSFAGSRCVSTNPFTYTPGPTDSRRVNIWFEDPVGAPGVWEPLPTQTVAYVPSAIESLNVGGFPIEALLRVVDVSGNPSTLPTPMSEAQYTNLMSLTSGSVVTSINGLAGAPVAITGTSGTDFNITTSGSNINFNIPSSSAANRGLLTAADWSTFNAKMPNTGAAVSAALGYTPLDPANNLSDLSNAATARGNLGLGTSATMSVPGAAAAAATAAEVVRGDDPRLTGAIVAGSAASGDLSGTYPNPSVATVGGRTAAQINQSVTDTLAATDSATASVIVKRDASGNASFATAQATNFSGNNFFVFNAGNANSIQIAAPTPLPSGDYILTLPDTAGTAGYVLSTDGAGNTTWIDPSSTSVTAVNANPPLSSSGGFTPTISIAQATTTTAGYLSSTDWTTFNNKLSTTLSTGQVWVGDGTNVATPQFLNISNIRSTVAGAWFNAGACASGEILSYSPVTDQVTCTAMTLTGSQVATALNGIMTGDATITTGGVLTIGNGAVTNAKISSVDWTKVFGTPTTYAGYGITDITLANAGNVNTVEAGLDAARGAFGTLGRVYFSTDTREIWYDSGAAWLRVGSNAGLGGTVTSVAVNAPLSLSGVATVNPTISLPQATVAVDGYLSSADFTTFSGKLDRAGDTMTGALNMGSNNITAVGNIAMSANRNIQIGAYAADPACAAPDAGKVWYHTPTGALHYCDGTSVQSLGSLSGVVTGLNGLTGAVSLVLGSAGTDASINTASPNITLNLPTSSAANRGLLSSTDWSNFNSKQAGSTELTGVSALATTGFVQRTGAGTYATVSSIDLTTSVSGVLPIANGGTNATTANAALNNLLPTQTANANKFLQTNGTNTSWADISAVAVTSVTAAATVNNPIVIAGTATAPTIDIPMSTAGVNGYLASTDFTTFNNKLGTTLADGNIWIGNGSNVATGVVMSGDASISNTGALTLATVSTAGTYTKVTIDTKGRVTSATNINSSDVTTALGYTPVNKAGDTMSGALNMGGQNITNTGVINMASNGNIQISNRAADPAGLVAGDAGRTWFNTTTNELKYWNGTSVQTLGTLAGVVTGVNGLTGGVTLNTGTTGTDFNISTSSPNVTFNFPTSSAANRGLLSSADWSIFNSKQAGSTELTGVAALATTGFVQRTGAGTYSTVSSIDISNSVTGTLAITNGGTGATTAGAARTNLGVGTGDSPSFTGLTVSGVTGNTLLRASGTGVVANATSADITGLLGFTPTSSTLATNMIFVGNGSNVATAVAMSGDASIVSSGTVTLKSVGTAGTYGSASAVPTITTDAQGRVTGVTTNAYQDATAVTKGILQVGNNLQVAGGTISLQNATAGQTGALTSADWTTFNNKQGALGFTPLNPANNLSDVVSADVSRTNLGLGIASSPTFTGLTLSGLANGFVKSVSGVLSGGNTIALSTDVTGVLPVANGGTGLSAAGANGNVMYVAGGTFATATPDTAGLVDKSSAQSIAGVKTFTANPIIDNASAVQFREATAGGTSYVGLRAPTALSADVTFTLPNADGTNGQVLKTDGAGNLGWVSTATGTVTSVTSANADIGVATTTTTPVLTLNSGLGANQIAKVGGSAISNNTVIVANGAGGLAGQALTDGQLLIGSTGAAPVAAGITGTANRVTVTNGAGTITLSGPQDIHSGASPTFTGLTLSAITGNTLLKANGSGVLANATSADVTTLLGFVPGAVSNVSGTAPISVATGTTTPVVSIAKATAGVDGYLAATDFVTFNSKMSSDFSNATGTLGIANGGTGAVTAAAARTNLGVGTGDSPSFTGLTVSGVTGNTLLRASGTGVVANATSADITTLLGFTPATSTLATNMIFVGNGSNVATAVSMSGDASIISDGTITLKNTGTAGTYGSASAVPTITTDAQGRVTGVTTNAYQDATAVGKGIVQVGNNISVAAGVISVATADGSTTGVITSGDWTRFDSKLSATIAAAATGQYIRFNGTNWVNSLMVSSDVTTSLGYTPLNPANNLSDVGNAGTSRTNLGLGTGDSPSFTGLTLSGVTGNTLLRANGSGVVANATSADITTLLGFVPGVGTVTNVTGTAPISVATGTSTPVVSIARATASADGYLASTDFTMFNSKMSSDFSNATGTLAIANGGTGAVTAAAARTNLGVGTGDSPSFTGLTVSGVTGNTLLRANGTGVVANATSADITTLLGFVPATNVLAPNMIFVGNGSSVATAVSMSGDASIISDGTITLKNTGTAGTYGSASAVPTITTDAQGRVTGVTTNAYQDGTAVTKGILQVGSNLQVAGGTISLQNATAGQTGALTSSDWTMFNAKLSATITAAATGQFIRYDGANWVNATLSSSDLTASLGYTPLNPANNLSDVANAGTSRTNLGLGSGNSPTFTGLTLSGVNGNTLVRSSGAGVLSNATSADVTTLLGYVPGSVTSVIAGTGLTGGTITTTGTIGLGTELAAVNALATTGFVQRTGAGAYSTVSSIDLTASVTGTLPIANGGTGAVTAGAARTNFGLGTGDSPSFTGLTVSGVTGNTLLRANGSGVVANATSADITTLLGFVPGVGTVTNVTGTAPISVATGTSTPVVSIARATASADGYLASTDFTMFNSKMSSDFSNATGTLAIANGGTGAVTAGAARTNFGLGTGDSPSFTGLTVSGVNGNTLVKSNGSGVLSNATSADVTTLLGFVPGSVTSVTSANADIGVATTTTTPVLTLNSGLAANQIAKVGAVGISNNTVIVANGAGGLAGQALTDGQLLIGSTGAAPVAATITGTANRVTVTNGAGTITLSGPQDIHSGASPSFTGLTLSGVTGNTLLRANGSGVVANATSADITTLLGFVPGVGTVTNVTGTAPISVATGTSTPVLSIARATASVDGYLASTDFSMFNSKMSSDFSNATGTLAIANGGTGAVTAGAARTNLGVGTGDSPSFTGLTVSGVNGNTLVKTNGSGVLANATSADVTTLLGFVPSSITSIAVGTGMTGGGSSGAVSVGVNAELQGLSGLATTGFVQRTGAGAYSTVSSIDLTTSVTGTLPIANGGTGAVTANTALNNLLPAQSTGSVLRSDGTNTSWLAFNTAASNNSLVQRDGSGITQAYGVGVSGSTSGSVTFTAPAIVTTYSLQLPAAQGGPGTVLQNNGAGVLSWGSASGSSTDLTNSVTGILPVANGGTGLSTGTSGGIPYFSAAATIASSGVLAANGVMLGGGAGAAPTTTVAGTANQVLRIPGGGGAPVFGSIDLSSTAAVTNSLGVANGGTGASTLTAGSLVVGNGTSAVNFLTAGTLGNVIYATGASTWASGTPTDAGLIAQDGNSYAGAMTIGTNNGNQLNLETNNSVRMSFDTSGAVRVNGQAYSQVATSSSATPLTWDANSSNTMRWSINTSTITANIHNMKPGAAYQLIVSGTGTGTTTINCFSDAGVTALTQGYMPANGNRVTGTRNKTVYTLMSDGESCLVTWITGF